MKFLALALVVALAACVKMPAPLPVLGHVSSFELTSEAGQPFSRQALDGKIWVADFIYTTCTGPCPRMSSVMRQVQQAVTGMPDVRLVSFTVDPDHDTPAALSAYAARYHAQADRWSFLTGPRESLQKLTRDDFKLGDVDGSMVHSTRFILLDRQSRIRAYYGLSDEDPVTQLVRDIKLVRAESSS